MYLLKFDIRSHCSGALYGSAGSKVKLIRDSDGVAIVEDEDGKRFSCAMSALVTDGSLVEASTAVKHISKPGSGRKGRSSKPGPTQTLF